LNGPIVVLGGGAGTTVILKSATVKNLAINDFSFVRTPFIIVSNALHKTVHFMKNQQN